MSKEILSYMDYPMVRIQGGELQLRDDGIKSKWKAEISPFLLARYPVTTGLYYIITNRSPNYFDQDLKPVVNISWNDAISFCNLLSQKSGLRESYSINGENIVCDWESNDFRLPSEAEWQFTCILAVYLFLVFL
ncbi:SUMF1/EgtB/PvdO family nonheme iron enzyme [Bacillus sp. SD075]|nr:SUMF1/EgtB/PvdO family nonheme iron enzyme [Bacillus sp. SD075]